MKKGKVLTKRILSFVLSVIMFCTLLTTAKMDAQAAGSITMGKVIYYNTFLPGSTWQTHVYTMDGYEAFCVESEKDQVNSGSYPTGTLSFDQYPILCLVLFLGTCDDHSHLKQWFHDNKGVDLTDDQVYLINHIAANYAYHNCSWYGLTEQQAIDSGIAGWVAFCGANNLGGYHMTEATVAYADPGGSAQKIAYLSSNNWVPINSGVDITLNVNKSKTAVGNEPTTNGAVYGLYDSSNNELARTTLAIASGTTATGSIGKKIENSGTYYVKEISAPTGYQLDPNTYSFYVDCSSSSVLSTDTHLSVSGPTITANLTDNPIRGYFSFTKKDEAGNNLAGVNFGIYRKYEVASGSGYNFASATPVTTVTTNPSGVATSPLLEYGTYVCHEVNPPAGKVGIDFETTVTAQGVRNDLGNKVDPTIRGNFKLTKKGDDGDPIANAGFSAYLKSTLPLNPDGSYDFTSASPVPVGPGGATVVYSDTNGIVTSEPLEFGAYVIMESVIPAGYTGCDPFEINIVSNGVTIDCGTKIDVVIPAKLQLVKKDANTNTVVKLAGTKFKIYDIANSVYLNFGGVEEFETDATGTFTTPSTIAIGTYRIEEIDAPYGYILNSTPLNFTFNGHTAFTMNGTDKIVVCEFMDLPKKGAVEITKTGDSLTGWDGNDFTYTQIGLPNAKFDVKARNDIMSPDGQGTVVFAADDVVGSITTNVSGFGTLTNMYLGDYYLVETDAPTGYVLDTTPIDFSLVYDNQTSSVVLDTETIINDRQEVALDLTKTDEETSQPLANAEFGIYAAQDIYTADGATLLFADGDLIKSARSNYLGKINFNLTLPFCAYTIKEINAPTNYVLNTTEFNFTATLPSSSSEKFSTYTYSWANTPVKGTMILTKKGDTLSGYVNDNFTWNEVLLKGAKFEVRAKDDIYTYDNAVDAEGNRTTYYKKDELIGTIVTDEYGITSIANLPIGNYYLVEIQAPDGMWLDPEPKDFIIAYEDQNTPFVTTPKTLINDRQHVVLDIKKKSTVGWNLTGGSFKLIVDEDIKNYAGVVIVTKDTVLRTASAQEGIIDFNIDLPNGKYHVEEIEPPTDYYRNDTKFLMDLSYTDPTINNLLCDLTIYNKRLPHFAKVSMVLGAKFLKKGTNNYVTEDNGEVGYSVILSDVADATEDEVPGMLLTSNWFLAIAGACGTAGLVALGGYAISLKKEKALVKKNKEEDIENEE